MHSTTDAQDVTRSEVPRVDGTAERPRQLVRNYADASWMLGMAVPVGEHAVNYGAIPIRKLGHRIRMLVAAVEAMASDAIEGVS